MNRNIDYGTSWAFIESRDDFSVEEYKSNMAKQLIYFHQQDIDGGNGHNSHIKAFFLHHLLDYFKETRINISNINAVFEIFLKEKIEIEIITNNGKKVNFLNEIHQIFDFLRKNKEELYSDLKGEYFSS